MPLARAAALMRWIHSRRKSPLRARRSRYAYCRECMTCSLADRNDAAPVAVVTLGPLEDGAAVLLAVDGASSPWPWAAPFVE